MVNGGPGSVSGIRVSSRDGPIGARVRVGWIGGRVGLSIEGPVGVLVAGAALVAVGATVDVDTDVGGAVGSGVKVG
jgi:kynureninase